MAFTAAELPLMVASSRKLSTMWHAGAIQFWRPPGFTPTLILMAAMFQVYCNLGYDSSTYHCGATPWIEPSSRPCATCLTR
jgi:hypothetical protein